LAIDQSISQFNYPITRLPNYQIYPIARLPNYQIYPIARSMRVIAGLYKGRRLRAPTWDGLRPTSDKLRETLFNVLAPRIDGARVLDGYAGTGAVGIEALSRGASHVTFVDRDHRARALIAENIARCGIPGGCAIIRPSFDRLGTFDIVLLDPPYDLRPDEVLTMAAPLVSVDTGLLVLEHARRQPAPETSTPLVRIRHISSGDSALTMYERS
jgi:16S rRNA (guanine966-N2)-methyltransferase